MTDYFHEAFLTQTICSPHHSMEVTPLHQVLYSFPLKGQDFGFQLGTIFFYFVVMIHVIDFYCWTYMYRLMNKLMTERCELSWFNGWTN